MENMINKTQEVRIGEEFKYDSNYDKSVKKKKSKGANQTQKI